MEQLGCTIETEQALAVLTANCQLLIADQRSSASICGKMTLRSYLAFNQLKTAWITASHKVKNTRFKPMIMAIATSIMAAHAARSGPMISHRTTANTFAPAPM